MKSPGEERAGGGVCLPPAGEPAGGKQRGGAPRLAGAQRLMLLDMAMRSGLPIAEFAPLVGLCSHTLYEWKRRFEKEGPEGLMDRSSREKEPVSRLPEVTKRAILMIRKAHPEYGCERISDMLGRGPGLGASPNAVCR